MKQILLTILFWQTATVAFSQHSSVAYSKLADSLYVHHHYQIAAGYYEKALKKSQHQGDVMLQLAKCYRKINLLRTSEKWFSKARKNHGAFSTEDYYDFAQVLLMLQKRDRADSLLQHVILLDPNNHLARKSLKDIRNFKKYYQDSASVRIKRLSINTAASEFAPTYYNEGIVFAASKQEGLFKKKSQWDNSPYLNLYYSTKTADNNFSEPKLFDDDLNTRHHDGPATFYAKNQKMIINRNQRIKVDEKENVFEMHPGLYDAQYDEAKSSWQVTPLPFNVPEYAYLHPSITEEGDTLYFASDKPGGYGGTDIYRAVRTNGAWGAPFNLGPVVNTEEDEAFPFLANHTLYFTSNGHGGLGGLDLFKSEKSVNGFTPPVNLGYPVNSTADDFSLIIDREQQTGYYASSRQGNDDIFSFQKLSKKTDALPDTQKIITMAARVLRADSQEPLGFAKVKVITFSDSDQELIADAEGLVDFNLKEGTAYLVIGTKFNLIGMHSGTAETETEKKFIIHPVPCYEELTKEVLAVGLVINTAGEIIDGYRASVKDRSTGEDIDVQTEKGMLTFRGERGKSYNIAVGHEEYDTALQKLTIPMSGPESEKFSVILEKKSGGLKKKEPTDNKMSESQLLVFDTDQGTSKMYVKSGESLNEITEKNGRLYLETPRGREYLGKGIISSLRADPSHVMKKLGMQKSDRTNLRNIYFDFDKATLDEKDKEYLHQVKDLLKHDPSFKLLIAGHADDRGEEDYNVRLSKRRVDVVTNYLVSLGIVKSRIIQKAYGESLPVVRCYAVNCSEEDYQKNRRAEFVLQSDKPDAPPLSKTAAKGEGNQY